MDSEIWFKILAILCWIFDVGVVLTTFYIGTENTNQKRYNESPFYYFCHQHGWVLLIIAILFGYEIFQLSYMFWNNTIPYIIDDYEGELISTHWTSSIKYKCAILLIVGVVYYIVKFLQRKKDFHIYKQEQHWEQEIQKENKNLKDREFQLYQRLEEDLPKIVNNLEKDTFIYIKFTEYNEGKIYKISRGCPEGIPLSIENEEFPWRDNISLDEIAHSLAHGHAYIYDITSAEITSNK